MPLITNLPKIALARPPSAPGGGVHVGEELA